MQSFINGIVTSILTFLSFGGIFGCNYFYRTYDNPQNHFSINLPRTWAEIPDERAVVLVQEAPKGGDDRFQENINVMATSMPDEVTMDVFFEFNKDELERVMPNIYDMSESYVMAKNRLKGKMLVFDNKLEGVEIRTLSAVFLKDKRVYIVTCVGEVNKFNDYSHIFLDVIQSLDVKT